MKNFFEIFLIVEISCYELSMKSIKDLSDEELHLCTLRVARQEQELALLTIDHLQEVFRRRLHLKQGYGSVFEYTVRALGFSEPAAAQRVQAMRLASAVPDAQAKLRSGEL